MSEPYVLVLYYSRHGATEAMANIIAQGIESVGNIAAKVRTVAPLRLGETQANSDVTYATADDLRYCSGLVLGSPTRFGNMAAPLKHYLDDTTDIWLSGGLVDKPAAVFTSSSTMHGGQETTLMSMMLPLIHHGAIMVGIPFSEPALNQTTTGGTPYGPSHVAGNHSKNPLSKEEIQICQHLGKRLATLVSKTQM